VALRVSQSAAGVRGDRPRTTQDGEADLGDHRPLTAGAEVVVDHVAKAFEQGKIVALDDASFRLEPAELVALTGPSGSGKSTLLNLLGALDGADHGSIVVGGRRLEHLEDPAAYRAEVVGFVFQFHDLIPTLSALENVQLPMIGRNGTRADRVERARSLLAEVGLERRMDARPSVLSGGERQRVAIARALANEPSLLLADEPTGSLDSETSAQVLRLLRAIRDDHGTTIFVVTNDAGLADEADRTLNLLDGRITPGGARRSG
jgi:putative ABC transport system ATP-binding protein